MAKEIDKIIQSKTAPKSNNVLWDNGENLKINRNGEWENANTTEIKEGSIPFKALAPLNDTDKNQALTNLGIDPVVWKYICNPCIIKDGNKVPTELIGEYSDDAGYEGGYCLKYPNLAMYKIQITSNRIDSEFGDANIIITPSYISKNHLGINDIYISKDYGVYAGNVYIDNNKNWAID